MQPQFDMPGQVWNPNGLGLAQPYQIDEHGRYLAKQVPGSQGLLNDMWLKFLPPPTYGQPKNGLIGPSGESMSDMLQRLYGSSQSGKAEP